MIRLFAALQMPEDVSAALARRQTGIENARWRPPESLHLTLKFFGDLREDVARDLDAELLSVRAAPFDLVLEGAGTFSEDGEPRAAWAGVREDQALARLARACETAGRRAGLKGETRGFKPHVTLAYLRHADPLQVAHWVQANNLLQSPPIRIDRFGLYSSRLGGEGPSYRLEAEYLL